MHYRTEASAERFLEIVSGSNAFDGVGGNQRETLRVLMPDDVCLIDTTSTDYAGRICRVRTPKDGKMYYMRLFYEGDTVLMCDPTDGEEVDRCKVDELECSGIVTAIVRKMEAEERPDMEAWEEFIEKYPPDKLMHPYYSAKWKYATAVKTHECGSGSASSSSMRKRRALLTTSPQAQRAESPGRSSRQKLRFSICGQSESGKQKTASPPVSCGATRIIWYSRMKWAGILLYRPSIKRSSGLLPASAGRTQGPTISGTPPPPLRLPPGQI